METVKDAPASTTGLRGIAAASSSVSDVNGEKGELIYQGYKHDRPSTQHLKRSSYSGNACPVVANWKR